MASVSQLGHIGIAVSDAKAWHDVVANILGVQVVPGDDNSTSYLQMDEYHHRLEPCSNGGDDLEFVGWEVPDPATLQAPRAAAYSPGASVTVLVATVPRSVSAPAIGSCST